MINIVERNEHKNFSEWYYEVAKKCHKKGQVESDPLIKFGHLSLSIGCLLISDDHLFNWFLYPKEFSSRSARHNSFITDRKIKQSLDLKTTKRVSEYPFMVLGLRNRMVYLSGETSINDVLNYNTITEVNMAFKEASYVRNLIYKL